MENAWGKEENAGINGVRMYQFLADVYDRAFLIHPHLRRVIDLRWGVGLAVHAERVVTPGGGEQAFQDVGRDHVISHRNDKGFILDKRLAS